MKAEARPRRGAPPKGEVSARERIEDVGSLFDREFSRSEAYSCGATSNDRRFSL
jgi:hypothetical protein